MKTDSCESCHQLGGKGTRARFLRCSGNFDSPAEAWERRVQSGQAGTGDGGRHRAIGQTARAEDVRGLDRSRGARANIRKDAPPRPQGIERNVVITQWDWADPKAYLHDEISTDKRNPTVNANGADLRIAGGEPRFPAGARPGAQHYEPGEGAVRDPNTPLAAPKHAAAFAVLGRRSDLGQPHDVHNPMFDEQGRVWIHVCESVRPENPAWCKAGSSHPSAKLTPVEDFWTATGGCTIRRPSRCR